LTTLAGCTEEKPQDAGRLPAVTPASELACDHDPAGTGTIVGRIIWDGPIPSVPGLEVFADLESHPHIPKRETRANPHAPQVNPQTRGVRQAVVFLRHVDLKKSRPWDHEPVCVEQND